MICSDSPWAGNKANTSPYFLKKTTSYFFNMIYYRAEITSSRVEDNYSAGDFI